MEKAASDEGLKLLKSELRELTLLLDCVVALVRSTHNPLVPGSSPGGPTNLKATDFGQWLFSFNQSSTLVQSKTPVDEIIDKSAMA